MSATIDLNADLGEGPGEAPLYALVSSANVACGGHAGDETSMEEAVRACLAHGVYIGAHPSYPDRERFGRVSLPLDPEAIADAVADQIGALARVASALGAELKHVKPHGALYNDAVANLEVAAAIARGATRAAPGAILVGLAGSIGLEGWRRGGRTVRAEGFADRGYAADGTLLPRNRPGALIVDPAEAAAQALRLARSGRCDALCIHSDTPGAEAILREVRRALEGAGFTIG